MKSTRWVQKTSCVIAAIGSLGAVLLVATPARSDQHLPAYLQSRFNLACTPDCTLCHSRALGGPGFARDAVTATGQVVKGGLHDRLASCPSFVPTDPSTYDTAFNNCLASSDTDGDGVKDLDEFKAGTDPNDGASGAEICGNGPTYGCVRVARSGSIDGVALLVSSAVLLMGIARVRRGNRSS